jgi:hypothetical protein
MLCSEFLHLTVSLTSNFPFRVLDKHRDGMIHAPYVTGKKFTGAAPFYSRPDVIAFKDFDVGKTYTRKVVLTNVSYRWS